MTETPKPNITDSNGNPVESKPASDPVVATKDGSNAVKPYTGDSLKAVKPDGREITLTKVEIARSYRKGETKWTYPGLAEEGFGAEQCTQIETFLGEKLWNDLVYTAFDAQLQRTWKETQSEDLFIKQLIDESGGRQPRSLSARLYKELTELKKAESDLAKIAKTPEQKTELAAITAKKKELFAQWVQAANDEVM